MGFGWEEVHYIAEKLEHVKSDLFFQRIDEMLGPYCLTPRFSHSGFNGKHHHTFIH